MSAAAEKKTRLDWALRYARLGWPIFPLAPRSKIPLFSKEQGGRGCLDATADENQVRSWWTANPSANIGLATGHRSFAVDIDIKKGGEESWDYLRHQHGALPETIEQLTGTGGKHILYQMPDFDVRNSEGKIAPGIDIRGTGGYIVVSPSIHPDTGRHYLWDGLAPLEVQAIAPAPEWLLEKLRAEINRPVPIAKPVAASIVEGNRNSQIFKLACSLRRKGLSSEEILATLIVSNDIRCKPPLALDELREIALSSTRYAPDAKANVFTPSAGVPPPGEEAPLEAADLEAAVDAAIEGTDMIAAIRLAPEIAKLRPMAIAIIKAKLKIAWGTDFPMREFDRALKDASSDGVGQNPPAEPPGGNGGIGGPDLCGYPLTDAGNGERIVALFGRDIRYCVEMKRWLIWDDKRWAIDELGMIREYAKQMARLLYAQAFGRAANIEKWARASESFNAVSAGLGSAATQKGIAISAVDLDRQALLLNCLNGIIDLKSGKLLSHDRELLITKLCPVAYQPDAKCPRFLDFLHWAMGATLDADLSERTVRMVSFLQRALGYGLTADTSEKAVFILHGEKGNNGKTTLLTLFRDLLGRDYSGQLVIDTVMSMKNQDATTRADLADLRGVRLVVTSEVEKEHRLSEGKIKYITAGMGNIKSCRKYENPIEFAATHKLFMDCNHRPTVRGVDDAIWRRLKLIPFEVTISDEEKDLHLLDKMRSEMPGVLAWAVRGCLAWSQDGLGDPPEVTEAGVLWREHDDPLNEFLQDCCDQAPELFIRALDLAAGYEWWAKNNRERYPLGREAFAERLFSKGFTHSRSRRIDGKQARTWEGIQLKTEISAQIPRREQPAAWWNGGKESGE